MRIKRVIRIGMLHRKLEERTGALLRIRSIVIVVLATIAISWIQPAWPASAVPLRYVFLVQNSGWMEPFFTDERTRKFDPAIAAFVERAAPVNAPIVIASFNKLGEISGRQSPDVIYSGTNAPGAVAAAIAHIDLPRRPDGRLANSDYTEALLATVKDILGASPGVIYMITNNRSAPNGREQPEDGPVATRTEAFNHLLKTSEAITRIVAWPLRFPAHGRILDEQGLVIYGIAYGDLASPLLRSASQSMGLRIDFWMRAANCCSTSSPEAWPRASFTCLKWSMSHMITDRGFA